MLNRMRNHGSRVAVIGVAAGALLVGWPMTTGATAGVRTPTATPVGNTFGGLTEQGNPVFVDLNSTRRNMVRTVAAIDLTCTTGLVSFTDGFSDLPVNRFGKFRRSYGPFTERNDDGTTTDYQGRIVGQLNDAKTRITGVWRLIIVEHDAAGAITDTCDSGLVSWKTKN